MQNKLNQTWIKQIGLLSIGSYDIGLKIEFQKIITNMLGIFHKSLKTIKINKGQLA